MRKLVFIAAAIFFSNVLVVSAQTDDNDDKGTSGKVDLKKADELTTVQPPSAKETPKRTGYRTAYLCCTKAKGGRKGCCRARPKKCMCLTKKPYNNLKICEGQLIEKGVKCCLYTKVEKRTE